MDSMSAPVQYAALERCVLQNPQTMLSIMSAGLAGKAIKAMVESKAAPRAVIISTLHTDSANLSRYYKRKSLSPQETESVLDLLRVLRYAENVFESKELAQEWLDTENTSLGGEKPFALMNTFTGRQLVEKTLRKIEFGEFS